MDSRRIDYLASRPATFLTFAQTALAGASRMVHLGIFRSAELNMALDGLTEAREMHKAGTLHYVVPEYMRHVLMIAESMPESFWVQAGLGTAKDAADSLAQMAAEGRA